MAGKFPDTWSAEPSLAAVKEDAKPGLVCGETTRRPIYWVFVFACLAICIAVGLVSVALGPDNNWDLRFYHLYAPWAYLNNRYLHDLGPAQYQGFFNPTLDFLFHGLVSSSLNEQPRLVAFIMGAVHGINGALILALAVHVLRPAQTSERWVLWVAAGLIGLSGAGFVSLIGTTTNDLINSIFILSALLGLLRLAGGVAGKTAWTGFLWPGLIAGIGLGTKLTAGIYIPGLGLLALIAAVRHRTMFGAFTFGAAFTIGFFIAAGHHLLTLWTHFGNPVFPLFNDIFRSPYWEFEPLRDKQFLPDSFSELMAYPFLWAKTNVRLVSELPFRDWRGAIAYGAIAAWALGFVRDLVARPARRTGRMAETQTLGMLILFVVLSYFAWAHGFSIYRYAVTLEMLTGAMIVGALLSLFEKPRNRVMLCLATTVVVVMTTIPLDWGRGVHPSAGVRPATYGDKYIDIKVPPLPKNSIVLLATWQPASYFIPYAEPSARYIGIGNNYLSLSQGNLLAAEVRRLMRSDRPKFIVSVGKFNEKRLAKKLRPFGLQVSPAPCEAIHSNLEEQRLSLCRAMPLQERHRHSSM